MTLEHLNKIDFHKYMKALDQCVTIRPEGKVSQVIGLIAEGDSLGLGIGALCSIVNSNGLEVKAEVVGFKKEKALFMPYGDIRGISLGSRIIPISASSVVGVSDQLLGRVVDGMGIPIDGKGEIKYTQEYGLYGKPISPLEREQIKEPLDVGVAAINSMITLGKGQRVAIMAGSGVGKSVLMGMMTKHTSADVIVIGLIGERGREVKDFIEDTLGQEGIKRAVVVAATSDSPPLVRMRGAYLATTIAEYFRDRGKNVLLMVDSITRYAMSSRDVGLAAGEPPTSKGYTPSFFVQIPILLERAGNIKNGGSITGIYTVLVEGDDLNDPVGDTVRSIVDGHIVLSRDLANRGHYPAIDVLASVSRVMRDVSRKDHVVVRDKAVNVLSSYRSAEDMITIGAYVDGSDPDIDEAKRLMPGIIQFLRQDMTRKVDMPSSVNGLKKAVGIK
ncbi:FliI/YscN family ATPase [Desulfobacula toluolica]|uniref:FliI: flagellum-specific ATP synthase n=1 Tax=Desulfobacula toluolica (strain DSM 7467 / Tol2) TaxID=651182 RepID=K0NLY5_DESTT|nr:FliI/YscN family ATPase [Desulfobacula toluolica]CCK81740.1 FliI: flagellum-specific ATP synthase [Desulfobacula toluolica Tol2]